MSELIAISEQIQKKIQEIDSIRKEIKTRGEDKARTESEYDKAITVTLIRLKNGYAFELDGMTIQNPGISIMDKLAKGLCWQQKRDMEVADAMYKSVISNLEAVKAQVNALQSLNKHLD
jgi:hypothetical protein